MKTLIQNGLLVDPANRIRGRLNILVENGKVLEVTEQEPPADRVIDASGRVVCPGFIDIHMHEDPVGEDGHIHCCIFDSMLRMGVTTAVGGNCGDNVHDPADYLEIVQREGAPVNVALFAGHNYFRKLAGAQDKYAGIAPKQLQRMLCGIQHALDAGCVGVSFGLRYVPGTDEAEFHEAVQLCAGKGKPISIHLRDDAAYVLDALDEAARAGLTCGASVQVSHIGSMGGFGQMERLLARMDAYRANGLDISADCYPYTAFSTGIGETTYDDGWLERYGCDYSACVPSEGRYRGVPCTKESFDELRREHPECITVCNVMRDADIRLALAHPNVMLGSDGFVDQGMGHPRAAGAFPRFFSEYVRGGTIGLYAGIEKMTAMPAKRLGLTRKGRLNAGADADIVIFDPQMLRDCATFEEPMLPPVGIDYVFIGGEIAAKDGRIIRNRLGRAIRK